MLPNVKKIAKILTKYLGLEGPAKRAYQRLMSKKLYSMERLVVAVDDIQVVFSTKDPYSKKWFLRYHNGGIHEEPVTRLLLEVLKNAKCFADVGTHLGWYTLLASKRIPNGVVFGFEMDEQNYDLFKKNIEINHSRNVTAIHAALSDCVGTVRYARELPEPCGRLRITPDSTTEAHTNLVEVQALTLDDFFADAEISPDVIKIDVEGAEAKVLRGMKRILVQGDPKIFLEVHPKGLPALQSSVEEVLSLLIDNGYKVHEIQEMRRPGADTELRPLSKNSILKENTMLYAEKRSR